MNASKRNGSIRSLALFACLLCGAAPLLQGCGLGTVGILVAVLMGGGEDETIIGPQLPGPSILFEEDFETDLSQWTVAGATPPAISNSGQTGDGLDPGGTTTENGEAVSRFAFNLDPGIAARASLQVTALGSGNTDLWFGFKEGFDADAKLGLLAGFYLAASQSLIRMHVNGVSQGETPIPDTGWHRYEIHVRPDGFVEFYIDGGLTLVSPARIDPLADYRPVSAGGKSLGAAVNLDDVEVFGYRPVRDVAFADSFGTDLTGWTLGSPVGINPSLDPFVTGNPSPALNPGGNASGVGEAVTGQGFVFTGNGLEIQADLYVSDLAVDNLSAWCGLAHQSGMALNLELAAGAALVPGSTADEIRYYLNNTIVHTETLAASGWYRFRTMIRKGATGGWRVEYHRDGELIHVSDTDLALSYDGFPVSVGGQSGGGTARIDNVAVLFPPSFQSPLFDSYTDTGSAPSTAIEGHVVVYDTKRDRALVAFGGNAGAASTAVYALNVSGTSAAWAQLAPSTSAGSPSARTYPGGVFLPSANSAYFFGGGSDASGTTMYQDTYQLDFTNSGDGAWVDLAPASPPSARFGHSLVYDPTTSRLILFGGEDSGGVTDDVWTFDITAGTWTSLSPVGGPPSGRRWHGAAFDEANQRMIVFGGEDGAGSAVADALWSLDFTAAPPVWTSLTPAGTAFAGPRWASGLALDCPKKRLYILGGRDGAVGYPDIFSLDLSGGSDGVATVDLRANLLGAASLNESGVGCTFDLLRKRLILVGGAGGGATVSTGDLNDDE